MPTEYIGEYLVEYGGEPLSLGKGWAAYIAVYDVTRNPAFHAALLPRQRVSLDTVFLTEEAAAEHARDVAVAKIGRSASAKQT